MSRIYVVTNRKSGKVELYVRAHNLNAAVRALAAELFVAEPLTTEAMYQASRHGAMAVLDSIEPAQADLADATVGSEPTPIAAAKRA